jgi:predicted transcriptional regulator of viral defense system
MTALDAYANLRRFGRSVITTADASLRLDRTLSAANRLLGRLAAAGLVVKLRRGLWSLDAHIDPLALPEFLTAPFPAYVSVQSALYFHGMISQIPQVVYVASLGPTRRVATSFATYSLHRLAPEFFGGFVSIGAVHMATPEKALLDTLYLSCAKSRLFARLPELELPPRFRMREARRWIARIPAAYRRTLVERKLEEILGRTGTGNREKPVAIAVPGHHR